MSRRDDEIAELIAPYQACGDRAYYLAFFECFNRRRFYEAHEVLEELWRGKFGPNRGFYQGLIQLAGAFVHLQKHRLGPALALFLLAEANLRKYPDRHEALDVAAVLSVIQDWKTRVATSRSTANPYSEQTAPELRLGA